MSFELRITSRAEADIVAEFEWYEARSPGLGVAFVRCVDAAIETIQRSPTIFRPRVGDFRLATTARFPYGVYFLVNERTNLVSVRRVLHFARNRETYLRRA